MRVTINGEKREIDGVETVLELLDYLDLASQRGIAVAVNDSVVPRTSWEGALLRDEDRVEIIRATQGG